MINLAKHPEKVPSSQQSQGVVVPILAKVDQGFKQLKFNYDVYDNIDENEKGEGGCLSIGEYPESFNLLGVVLTQTIMTRMMMTHY